ncbi:hypothetical protein HYS31_07290 [Candidatus Woesearchaeota archaeon]|nr:hypothetical protein [Candidatus Woesearchaeota archaeon]
MDTLTLSPHHVERFLALLLMKDFRAYLLSRLYTAEQREHARKAINSFDNGLLKNIEIIPSDDSVCQRCISAKFNDICGKLEPPLRLNGRQLDFGVYSISDLGANFSGTKYRAQLFFEAHIFG